MVGTVQIRKGMVVLMKSPHYPHEPKFCKLLTGKQKNILVEYFEDVKGHDGNSPEFRGKRGHCWWWNIEDILDHGSELDWKDMVNFNGKI